MRGTRLDGLTPDEPYHMLAGAAYVTRGDFRLNPEHPPLAKLPAGLALASSLDLRPLTRLADKVEERDLSEATVFLDNDWRVQQRRARAGMYAFHAALLAVFLALAWRVLGGAWALVTGAWLALEPTLLAHMPVVMTDLPLALALGAAALAAGLAFETWRWRWVAAAGVTMGLALAAKHSALPGLAGLAVTGLAFALWPLVRRQPREAARRFARLPAILVLALATLWGHYGFRFHAAPDGSDPFNRPLEDKIADVSIPTWRAGLSFADRARLVPRAYTWGLADTVRAGVEGRGQDEHMLYGRLYIGAPPWFFWPGIVSAKVPIPLLLLSAAGLVALAFLGLRRSHGLALPTGGRAALVALGAASLAHLLALMSSRGTYGGVRHALPLVLALGVVAGGITVARGLAPGRRAHLTAGALTAVLLATALFGTAREPRLWEFHNAFAGGTGGAAAMFTNESVLLGQRTPEIARYWREELGAPDTPIYAFTWIVEEEAQALGLPLTRRVDGIHDDNAAGVFEGLFLVEARLRHPGRDWDPSVLDGLEELVRLGNVYVMRGRIESPEQRAWGLFEFLPEYLNDNPDPDWRALAARMREMIDALPWATTPRVLLGNAHLALGERADALDAYRGALEASEPDDPFTAQIREQIARLESESPLEEIPLLRNPSME